MKYGILLFLAILSSTLFAQEKLELGTDNNPSLTEHESEFFNIYLIGTRNDFDFKDKKVAFVSGGITNKIETKNAYFEEVRNKTSRNSKVPSTLILLTKQEKIDSGGFDAIIGYRMNGAKLKNKSRIIKRLKTKL